MLKSVLAAMAGLFCAALAASAAWSADTTPKSYVVDNQDLDRLRADFNANAGKVRLLFIVGPTCAVCLSGLEGLEQALYAKKKDDPRLVTFVVHVPTLGAREEHVGPAAQVIKNAYARNYWEETGVIGKRMQEALGANGYIWDFWSMYEPDVQWSDAKHMPAPGFWQHQLRGRLPADRLLNPTDFAAHVDALLARLPG